ncbi:hypothetical protein L2E82_31974 [Cichorium intybus]|uniref:Uncharacterized protein n=1 Tax=Cichorium intybus TaxID=13427 RepID=A0ACB9BG85_CICIN|nr:hypothetical protein L2E82_31974 [Cichorium intybus]
MLQEIRITKISLNLFKLSSIASKKLRPEANVKHVYNSITWIIMILMLTLSVPNNSQFTHFQSILDQTTASLSDRSTVVWCVKADDLKMVVKLRFNRADGLYSSKWRRRSGSEMKMAVKGSTLRVWWVTIKKKLGFYDL